jgi:hypothetical protein
MTGLWLGLAAIASGDYDEIAATAWYAWYRARYSKIWEFSVDSIPAPIQALLPYLKFILSLVGVVVTSVVTAGIALPAWAVLLSSVASSVLVFLASNNLGQAGSGGKGLVPWKPWREPYVNPLELPSDGPVTGVPAADVSATAVPPQQ